MNASLRYFCYRIGLVDASVRRLSAPVVKSGYHLRFPTSYPGFKSRRAHHHTLLRSVHLPGLCRAPVQTRQKLGIVLMLLFMPINGPLWRMGLSELGYESPLGEFQGFALTLLLFVIGAAMVITPKLRLPTE